MDTPPRYLQGTLPQRSTPSHPIDQSSLDVSLFCFVDWYGSVELVPLVEFVEERTVHAMLRVYFAVRFMCYVVFIRS